MTWNLWNVIRHYAYIKYFKNKHRELGSDASAWNELETYTKRIVKGIYRTFKQKQWHMNIVGGARNCFSDVDNTLSNNGGYCHVKWTNSFIEIQNILERNAREHDASFVLFTGDIPAPSGSEIDES